MSETFTEELERLRAKLAAAEQALEAIRDGEADAILVPEDRGYRVFTLRGAEHPYRIFLEQMQEGAVALDRDGAIVYANRRTAEMLAAPLEKVMGSDLESWVAPASRSGFRAWLEQALAGAARCELDLIAMDGKLVPVCLSGRSPGGDEIPALCVVITDLTEPRRREEELRRQAELLARARQELERQAVELARSNAELDQFASVLAHDLKEPLRAVLNYARLFEERCRDRLDARGERFLAHILAGAERLDRMIEGLLEFSRVTTRGRPLAPTDAEAVFRQACADLRALIEQTGASITHDPLPVVLADETQLLRVLENLLANALKFRGAEPPRVHVRAQRRQRHWVFAVSDNGVGIEPQEQERIFAPFQRGQAHADCPGDGLGLAIARRIVERHGGKIWVESTPGRGSTFYFSIPAAAEAVAHKAHHARAGHRPG